jgi:hypothetical protein
MLDDGSGLEELDIGDGLASSDGEAVSFVHRTAAGRVAAVALLGVDAGAARIVDLAPTFEDAPPPRLASCRQGLVAAAFAAPHAGRRTSPGLGSARELALYLVHASGAAQRPLSIAQHRDDSLAFDIACSGAAGLLVWDETVPQAMPRAPARGVVRAAAFEAGEHTGTTHDVSPTDSDAEMPRVVSNGAGFFVLWLSRRLEGASAPDPPNGAEANGEVRAFGWLEMVAVDAAGSAIGAPRRLTPTLGHVSAYDVRSMVDQPRPTVLIVARDDGERVDDTGGSLFRLRVRDDWAEVPTSIPIDGLGRGGPVLVDAPVPWLAWVGPHEELRLVPLDAAGMPVGAPSAEAVLDETRPLMWRAQADRMLVAAPRDRSAQLRVFACQR